MGVEYDLKCMDCREDAFISSGCSKNRWAMQAVLTIRPQLEQMAREGVEFQIVMDGFTGAGGIEPSWFLRHEGHRLVVASDAGRDYTNAPSSGPFEAPLLGAEIDPQNTPGTGSVSAREVNHG